MRLRPDEPVPKRLGRPLPRPEVRSVIERGWGGVKNGALLALAGPVFDAFVTVDKKLPYQQDRTRRPVAVVLLGAVSNERQALIRLLAELEEALGRPKPHSFVRAGAR